MESETKKQEKKKDYEGFVTHVEAWEELGIPYGLSDLRRLAIKYNTPILY